MTGRHKTCYEHYATGGQPKAVFDNFKQSVLTIWRASEIVKRERNNITFFGILKWRMVIDLVRVCKILSYNFCVLKNDEITAMQHFLEFPFYGDK